MKKLIIAITLMMFATAANAGLWDSIATSDFPVKETTSHYKLDVYGYNVRVYEWTPENNPDVRCVFVAGSENSSGVACYEVKKNAD